MMKVLDRHVPVTSRTTSATVDAVWAVLADGWSYPCWVVGAARTRSVSSAWPALGAVLHHSVGVWPVMLDDRTTVTASVPEQRLELRGRAWPFGEAVISIELQPAVGGGCELRIGEDVVAGPALLMPRAVRGVLLKARNTESLQRLALLAERRTGGGPLELR